MATARAEYETRVTQFRAELVTLDRQGGRLANLRTLTFLGFIGLGFAVGFDKIPRWGLLGALACLAGYIALAVIHAGVIRREDFAKMRLSLNERGLLRLQGRWHDFPSTGEGRVPDGHLYGGDLDITGRGSLFQRLDDTGTAAGEQRLLDWLLTPAQSAEAIHARQGAVRELGPLIDFRQTLVAEARMAGKKDKADPSRFLAWAEAPSTLNAIRWAWPIAHVLPVFTITAGLLSANDVINALPFWIGLVIQIAIVVATRKPIGAMWEALSMGEHGFIRFEQTFASIDAQKFAGPRLLALQQGLMEGPPVSARLRTFARLMGFAELKHSGQMHPIINALTLWDLLVLFRIDRWRETQGKGARQWFEALAEFEALSSFATWHFERPEDAFPQVDDGAVHLEAVELGHPLLEKPIRNDVTLSSPGTGLVITGSNMSGKTTLMRATGLNTVMALAGLPVCANSMKVSRVQVLTSMRVKDSLERGVSYFYAEVQRIKTVLDTAKEHTDRCLFFLDELFMGTNAKERQIASRQLLLMLLDLGAAGAVTTHDLSICELAKERPEKIRNVHFRDEVKDGEMTFDYRLREGVVQTTNALEVLRRAGVQVG
ncbi:MAG: DNA mismatch repair protein MutS [Archangium sp.]|nr:DNA mismatch repair protein MutS [Archangium sp.]MDP3155346.1 DNA mismatch repair protein MutS [Archangium sp.]MDP3573678.1 DNA mismatch repair protein MutS [Archangium sp.]